MACKTFTKPLLGSPQGVNGKLPANTPINVRLIVQGPNPHGFDPDMSAACQKADFIVKWTVAKGCSKPVPKKGTQGAWGYWKTKTGPIGLETATLTAVIKQKSTGITLTVTKTWELK